MMPRPLLALILVLAAALPAVAQDPAAAVVEQLRAQGYVSFEVSRTLLGRIRVLASRPEGSREIVFNPTTGEILRDLWEPVDTGDRTPEVLDRTNDAPRTPDDGVVRGSPSAGGIPDQSGDPGRSGGRTGDGGAGEGPGSGGEDGRTDPGGDGNRGHGNDADGVDDDNPGQGGGRNRNGGPRGAGRD